MMERPKAAEQRRVDASEYTETYFLTACEGYKRFTACGGRSLGPRFDRALELARIRAGERVLDVGCGRGEIIAGVALLGARAVGVDYAPAAVRLAESALDALPDPVRSRASVHRMDAAALGFGSGTFDVVFMLDLVEHLYPAQLDRALDEAFRVLKESGRLVIHTSPNALFEQVVYPRYVRHVHKAVLAVSSALRLHDGVLNPTMLPTAPQFPHADFDRRLHVNAHSPQGLAALVDRHGFRVGRLDFWEPPGAPFYASRRLNLEVKLLDFIRYLRPLSLYPPLNRWFCNHIWLVAERPAHS